MSDDAEFRRLIKENIRWKQKYREAMAQLESVQADYTQLQADYDELDTEVSAYLDEVNDQPVEPVADEIMEELQGFRRKSKLEQMQEAINAVGKFRDGVKAEHIAAMRGLNLDDDMDFNDDFRNELLTWAQKDASILLSSDEPVADTTATNEVNGRSSVPPVVRRLPTFNGATGGGASLPANDPISQVQSLRDPAAAIRRAAEARNNGANAAS